MPTQPNNTIKDNLIPNGKTVQLGKATRPLSPTEMRQYIKHTFEPNDRLKAAKIEVNARKNRRVVIVLGEDGRQMRILDIDYKAGDDQLDLLSRDVRVDEDDEMADS